MAKLTAWLVIAIALLLLLPLFGLTFLGDYSGWLIAIAVLAIGVGKLIRNYKKR
ncbi:MAG TPA: hypothetical protein VMZ91_10610 [Candidatus Paceibacterota bacterium]|nr:hypothetical protein [Candidatus Paceibacterota bacterium]